MIRHILLFNFNDIACSTEIEKLRLLFESMPEKVEGVLEVEWGLGDSPENKNQGYTHSVLMTFANEAGRQNYLPHPEHEALKLVFGRLLGDLVVFDYQV